MKCPKCRKQLRKGAKFCPACGTRVEKKRGIRFTSILLVIVLLLSIVAIGWSGGILFAKYFGGNFKDLFSRKETIEIHNVEEAIAHARELGEDYGYENAMSEMTEKVTTTIDGDSYYRLQQNYQGIPVYGRTVVYALDEDCKVTSISGNIQDINSVDLSIGVTDDAVKLSVQQYLNDLVSEENIDDFEINNDNLSIYTFLEDGLSHLVYRVFANGYEILIDAHTGNIVSAKAVIRAETGYLATDVNRTNGFSVTQNSEGLYTLEDSELRLSVYNLNGKSGKKFENRQRATPITSTDLIFGNASEENGSEEAVRLYRNISEIKKYITSTCGFDCYWLFAFYNDGYNGGENALGGSAGDIDGEFVGMVSFGRVTGVDDIDAMAHEYGHVISFKTVEWSGNSVENNSINEGISDIFGEITEAHCNNLAEPNWIMTGDNINVSRNIHSPNGISNAAHVDDSSTLGEIFEGKEYYYSTVISHAAYLMWNGIDGTESAKISSEDIIRIWYRAMLMMPADCDFATCRQMVEWAALSVDGITDAQRDCIAEAFDMVGIEDTTLSPEILVDCDRNVRPDSVLNVYNVEGDLHPRYTLNISGTVAERELSYASSVLSDIGYRYETTEEITKAKSYHLDLPDGYYTFTITDSNNPLYSYTFTVSVSDQGTDNTIELHTDFEDKLVVKVTDPPISNAYETYISAANKTMNSGSWSEHLNMTADMAITDGSAKTKTKVTLTSNADVSNYSESDPSQIRMSGSAEMTVMGQTYAWDMEYENGTAHYQYTKPNQTSADMKIDPSFFNFGTMTSDMMSNAKISGNKITFTVPGEKIAEVGIAAVNQMSGVDDLEYGDVDVTVTISNDGKIDNIIMAFHASLEYQGYDADVDYNIDYRFSDSPNSSSQPVSSGVPIVPGIYAQDGSDYNTLTVHETDGQTLEFTAFWYRIADIYHAIAEVNGNAAAFEYIGPDVNWQAAGTLQSPSENTIVLTISDSTHEYINTGEYRYSLIGKIFSDAELKAISAALNVPTDLDAEITQGEPGYWEGGGIYRTPIDIYYNGELIAGASVNSLTGEIAGNIYVYSAPDASGNSVNLASTFGFSKVWDIHDRSGTEHFVTSLAFSDDGTFCCAVGWYLSEWYVAFTGTYQVQGNEIILNYTIDGDEKMSSYQVKWVDQTLRQTSEENIVIAHQIGSEYPFEENPWYTVDQLKDQVSTFMRYNG